MTATYTERKLVDRILDARTIAAYKTIDAYLAKHPKAVTFNVAVVLEAYELYRLTLSSDETSTK